MSTSAAAYREPKTLADSDGDEDESDESSNIYLFSIYLLL